MVKKLKSVDDMVNAVQECWSIVESLNHKKKKEIKLFEELIRSEMISEISKGENLDESILRDKYLTKKKKKVKETVPLTEEKILFHTNINDQDLWYENTENGTVYQKIDDNTEKVGTFLNGKIVLDN